MWTVFLNWLKEGHQILWDINFSEPDIWPTALLSKSGAQKKISLDISDDLTHTI